MSVRDVQPSGGPTKVTLPYSPDAQSRGSRLIATVAAKSHHHNVILPHDPWPTSLVLELSTQSENEQDTY